MNKYNAKSTYVLHAAAATFIFMLVQLTTVYEVRAARFCGDRVAGGTASGETEIKAREAATAWWSSRAGALGKGYEDWQSASEKDITCETTPDGPSKCTAFGRPCLPEGTMPENVPKLDL
ncbi:MAG: hypothetical protein CTY31_04080 [Hyphomicrobium sp.]|nr:MAG: hypothetical protein CTY31_04080 [Hyphomicrobium sp.]